MKNTIKNYGDVKKDYIDLLIPFYKQQSDECKTVIRRSYIKKILQTNKEECVLIPHLVTKDITLPYTKLELSLFRKKTEEERMWYQ